MNTAAKILIVEDDLPLAEMLSQYFRVQGYNVLTASYGELALHQASEAVPQLIVLDIHLPDLDGFEVCERLRESHKTRNIPVIFLTERTDRLDRIQGLQLGVYDYITKPFDLQELRLRVRNTLHRASAPGIEHPVTMLPEGEPVYEALAKVGRGSGLLITSLRGNDTFRELYGFVASDDVLRVSSLMIRNATLEIGGRDAFCGHIDDNTLIVLAPRFCLPALEARIRERAAQSLEYFYPSSNRGENAHTQDRLRLVIGRIDGVHQPINDLIDLKQKVLPPG